MVDQFLINAIIGGLSIAAIAGLLGSFVLWKNMTYFGDALSHSALLGVTLGILLNININIAVILIAAIFAFAFSYNKTKYSSDTTLGILSYSALSLAIILASYSKINIDLMSYLFGDILAINLTDISYLILATFFIGIWIYYNYSKLIMLSISQELLIAEGGNSKKLNLEFSLILALFVALSFKIVGILLITAMLILPAASALNLSRSPKEMILYSILIGCTAVIFGIILATYYNLPTGPAIITTALGLFIVTNATSFRRMR